MKQMYIYIFSINALSNSRSRDTIHIIIVIARGSSIKWLYAMTAVSSHDRYKDYQNSVNAESRVFCKHHHAPEAVQITFRLKAWKASVGSWDAVWKIFRILSL